MTTSPRARGRRARGRPPAEVFRLALLGAHGGEHGGVRERAEHAVRLTRPQRKPEEALLEVPPPDRIRGGETERDRPARVHAHELLGGDLARGTLLKLE